MLPESGTLLRIFIGESDKKDAYFRLYINKFC